MPRDLAVLEPELARALSAVWRVARVAGTTAQRAAASTAADRWTALAVAAGWTQPEIAAAVGVRQGSVSVRVVRERARESRVPTPRGVLPVPSPPVDPVLAEALRRRRLIAASDVAKIVGCRPASVTAWAAARDVLFEWSPGRAKRLYERSAVYRAADRFPLQTHQGWRRRKNLAVPPQNRVMVGATVRPRSH